MTPLGILLLKRIASIVKYQNDEKYKRLIGEGAKGLRAPKFGMPAWIQGHDLEWENGTIIAKDCGTSCCVAGYVTWLMDVNLYWKWLSKEKHMPIKLGEETVLGYDDKDDVEDDPFDIQDYATNIMWKPLPHAYSPEKENDIIRDLSKKLFLCQDQHTSISNISDNPWTPLVLQYMAMRGFANWDRAAREMIDYYAENPEAHGRYVTGRTQHWGAEKQKWMKEYELVQEFMDRCPWMHETKFMSIDEALPNREIPNANKS